MSWSEVEFVVTFLQGLLFNGRPVDFDYKAAVAVSFRDIKRDGRKFRAGDIYPYRRVAEKQAVADTTVAKVVNICAQVVVGCKTGCQRLDGINRHLADDNRACDEIIIKAALLRGITDAADSQF